MSSSETQQKQQEDEIVVYVRQQESGKKFKLVARGDIRRLRAKKVKHYLLQVTGVPIEDQVLVYFDRSASLAPAAKQLDDEEFLGQHGVSSGDTIELLKTGEIKQYQQMAVTGSVDPDEADALPVPLPLGANDPANSSSSSNPTHAPSVASTTQPATDSITTRDALDGSDHALLPMAGYSRTNSAVVSRVVEATVTPSGTPTLGTNAKQQHNNTETPTSAELPPLPPALASGGTPTLTPIVSTSNQPLLINPKEQQPVYMLVRTPYSTVDAAVQGLGLQGETETQAQQYTLTSMQHQPGLAILPDKEADVTTAKPHERIVQLQFDNAGLRAELDDLHAKLRNVEDFKEDVLMTIKGLKQEVSCLSEEVLLGNGGDW